MSRLLSALALVALFSLTGCAVLDSLTGADDPEVVAGDKPSVVEQVGEGVDSVLPAPWGIIAGGVLGYSAKAYRDARVKLKEATA